MARSERGTFVAVVGGGPAGATTALALARAGASVVVVERAHRPARRRPGEALPDGALPVLARLDAGDLVDAPEHLPVSRAMAYWDGGVGESLAWSGWLVDRSAFEAGLEARSRAAGAVWWRGLELRGLRRDAAGWRLFLGPSVGTGAVVSSLTAEWLVDATGRPATVARRLGRRLSRRGRLVAACAEVPSAGCPGIASGEFLVRRRADGGGWLYLAGLAATVSCQLVASRPPRDAGTLRAEIAAVSGIDVGLLAGPRLYPAHNAWLASPCGTRWLAVGDAACAFDPLSGYGLTFAFGTGWYAACAILSHREAERTGLDAYRLLAENCRRQVLVGLDGAYARGSSRRAPMTSLPS